MRKRIVSVPRGSKTKPDGAWRTVLEDPEIGKAVQGYVLNAIAPKLMQPNPEAR